MVETLQRFRDELGGSSALLGGSSSFILQAEASSVILAIVMKDIKTNFRLSVSAKDDLAPCLR